MPEQQRYAGGEAAGQGSEYQGIQEENRRIRAENQRIQAALVEVSRERDTWRQTAQAQLEQARMLDRQLADIHSSPGWRLILKYRDWLQFGREFHPWVVKCVQPLARWFLRRSTSAAQPALSSQTPTGGMAGIAAHAG